MKFIAVSAVNVEGGWTLAACGYYTTDEDFDAPPVTIKKFLEGWVNQLYGAPTDKKTAPDIIAAYYAWRHDPTLKSDALQEIAKYPYRQRMPLLCDVPTEEIGLYWTRVETSPRPAADAIGNWAEVRGVNGVVWTALRPRFSGEYRTPSETEVVAYLANVAGAKRADAEKYCRHAPAEIRAPYRAALEAQLGWQHVPGSVAEKS